MSGNRPSAVYLRGWRDEPEEYSSPLPASTQEHPLRKTDAARSLRGTSESPRGRNDEKKAAREMQVFEDFVKRSGLPIDRQSIRKCDPPEPDMLCKVSGEYVAFELAEVCSPEIPREISHIPPTEGVSRFIRSGNPVSEIARKKIEKSKNYRTDYPIELLFYTDGRVVQPPDMSILSIQDSFHHPEVVDLKSKSVWIPSV